jgi:hypothetical protein
MINYNICMLLIMNMCENLQNQQNRFFREINLLFFKEEIGKH